MMVGSSKQVALFLFTYLLSSIKYLFLMKDNLHSANYYIVFYLPED